MRKTEREEKKAQMPEREENVMRFLEEPVTIKPLVYCMKRRGKTELSLEAVVLLTLSYITGESMAHRT